MKRVASILYCLAVICVLRAQVVQAEDAQSTEVNVSGTWKAKVEVGGQTGEPVFTFEQDGDKVTGEYEGYLGKHNVTGKVTGDKVEFEFTTDQGKVVYTGTVVKDDMKGETKYGDSLSGTWTAKRELAKVDVTGIWEAEVEVAGQTGEPVFTFEQEGDKLTGEYEGYLGKHNVTGKVTDDKIEFEFTTDQGKVIYTGTVAKDRMKGETKYGDSFSGTWTAKRRPTAKAATNPAASQHQPEQFSPGVLLIRDIAYIPDGDEAQRLDLYLPEKPAESPLPLVVHIHGGGWMGGSKLPCPFVNLVSQGYAVASVEYRFSQKALFPAQIQDCQAAIRWLRANSQRYNIDPDHFGAVGGSAGGHLSALLGSSGGKKTFPAIGEYQEQSDRVQCVCDIFGPANFTSVIEEAADDKNVRNIFQFNSLDDPYSRLIGVSLDSAEREKTDAVSPVHYVSKETPPMLILHGTHDALVPYAQSEELAAALKAGGVPVWLQTLPGSGHGGPAFEKSAIGELIQKFFDKHLKGAGGDIELVPESEIAVEPRQPAAD
jgi:acetyl esterase/lipase